MRENSVVVLFKGGRLPGWHGLTPEQRRGYERRHVDLMLSVARQHRMVRLEGYRLIATQEHWTRFWVIEFPSLAGAEAWMDAEIEPPYGRYGYHEYYLGRPWVPEYLAGLATGPPRPQRRAGVDPHDIPALDVDRGSVVVLRFARQVQEDGPTGRSHGDMAYATLLASLARDHGLARLEGFRLIGPQPAWHWVCLAEFPTFAGAEAWIEAELLPERASDVIGAAHLSRKWAPDYFALWAPG